MTLFNTTRNRKPGRLFRLAVPFTAATLLVGGVAIGQEGYDAEGGINWFGDNDNEAFGAFDEYGSEETDFEYDYETEVGYEDNGFLGDEGLYGEESEDATYEEDEYGYYDSGLEYTTDDEAFGDFYGESDELF